MSSQQHQQQEPKSNPKHLDFSRALAMLLNSLYDAVVSNLEPTARKDSLRLLAFTYAAHPDSSSTHLTKIIGHVIKCLKDSDSAIRDACRDAIGSLSNLYLKALRLLLPPPSLRPQQKELAKNQARHQSLQEKDEEHRHHHPSSDRTQNQW